MLRQWYAERKAAIVEVAYLTLQLAALHYSLAFSCTGPTRGWWKTTIIWGMILAMALRRTLAVARLVRIKALVHKARDRVSTDERS